MMLTEKTNKQQNHIHKQITKSPVFFNQLPGHHNSFLSLVMHNKNSVH